MRTIGLPKIFKQKNEYIVHCRILHFAHRNTAAALFNWNIRIGPISEYGVQRLNKHWNEVNMQSISKEARILKIHILQSINTTEYSHTVFIC